MLTACHVPSLKRSEPLVAHSQPCLSIWHIDHFLYYFDPLQSATAKMRPRYETPNAPKGPYTVLNLFRGGRWRLLACLHLAARFSVWLYRFLTPMLYIYKGLWYLGVLIIGPKNEMYRGWPRLRDFHLLLTRSLFIGNGKSSFMCFCWWTQYFLLYSLDIFEEDYLRAWYDRLHREGAVVWVNIFLGSDVLCVPLSFDKTDDSIGTDRQTFESLRMWYSWLQVRRGFSEVLIPKRLVRVDRVSVRLHALERIRVFG